jgi:hypothetical protein
VFKPIRSKLRERGLDRTALRSVNTMMLGEDMAFADASFERLRSDGSVLEPFQAGYLCRRRNLSSRLRHFLVLGGGLDAGFALGWVVDPRDGGQLRWCGPPVSESGWVGLVGGIECAGSFGPDLNSGAVVDRCRGV